MSSYPLPPANLSAAEREALAAIAAHERAADPDFVRRLVAAAPGPDPDPDPATVPPVGSTAGRVAHPRTLVLVGVLVVLAGLALLPGAWLLAIVGVAILVVIPTVLVVWALRQGRIDPDRSRPPGT